MGQLWTDEALAVNDLGVRNTVASLFNPDQQQPPEHQHLHQHLQQSAPLDSTGGGASLAGQGVAVEGADATEQQPADREDQHAASLQVRQPLPPAPLASLSTRHCPTHVVPALRQRAHVVRHACGTGAHATCARLAAQAAFDALLGATGVPLKPDVAAKKGSLAAQFAGFVSRSLVAQASGTGGSAWATSHHLWQQLLQASALPSRARWACGGCVCAAGAFEGHVTRTLSLRRSFRAGGGRGGDRGGAAGGWRLLGGGRAARVPLEPAYQPARRWAQRRAGEGRAAQGRVAPPRVARSTARCISARRLARQATRLIGFCILLRVARVCRRGPARPSSRRTSSRTRSGGCRRCSTGSATRTSRSKGCACAWPPPRPRCSWPARSATRCCARTTRSSCTTARFELACACRTRLMRTRHADQQY